MDLGQLRRAAVRQALRATRGHKGRAARLLGVHANTMTRLLGPDCAAKTKTASDNGDSSSDSLAVLTAVSVSLRVPSRCQQPLRHYIAPRRNHSAGRKR